MIGCHAEDGIKRGEVNKGGEEGTWRGGGMRRRFQENSD